MGREKTTKKNEEEVVEKRGFLVWVKEHKKQLILSGVSVTTVIFAVLGIKKKETVIELWSILKEKIEKGSLGSSRWLKKASLEELNMLRKDIQRNMNDPILDMDYRNLCHEALHQLDNIISERKYAGKEIGCSGSVPKNWYLGSDD